MAKFLKNHVKIACFLSFFIIKLSSSAEMAEWSNAHDSKSCYGQLYGGSNPSLCAIGRVFCLPVFFIKEKLRAY